MVLNRVGRRERGFEPFLIRIRSLTFNKLGNLSGLSFLFCKTGIYTLVPTGKAAIKTKLVHNL